MHAAHAALEGTVLMVEAGQLWRRFAGEATHVVQVVHGGRVRTRSVEGGFDGLEGDFEEQFVRILSDAEKSAMRPYQVARRQGGHTEPLLGTQQVKTGNIWDD